MNKTVGCTLLIKDDFNNVLVLNKKVKGEKNRLGHYFQKRIGEKKVMKNVLIER